ncbi:unnamed protein product [Rhizoctonia solani]|uniref:Uncharacterized protein n=1 Tax=Rhizoctonia solani TaxID=456999 RepID=A0A8H2XR27_9AGAM|nr:unnamed protein product [Rhizoctonia solani]
MSRQKPSVTVDFILVDTEEEETESSLESYTRVASSTADPSFYTEIQPSSIPPIIHSDRLHSAICPSGNLLDSRGTHPSLPFPMGTFDGSELCLNASFKGYLTTLLVPCIWLVLGSYVFAAIMSCIFCKLKNQGLVLKDCNGDVDKRTIPEEIPDSTFVSAGAPPSPEAVLEHTLKQYGHIADSDLDSLGFELVRCSPPSNQRPKPPTLDRKALQNTVRRDIDAMFRGAIPDNWTTKEYDLQGVRFRSSLSSTHAAVMNVRPIVPTRSLTTGASVQVSDLHKPISSRLVQPSLGIKSGVLPRATRIPAPRPLITADPWHLAPMKHRCFSSSPLKSSHTASSSSSPNLCMPVSGGPVTPENGLKESMWTPS